MMGHLIFLSFDFIPWIGIIRAWNKREAGYVAMLCHLDIRHVVLIDHLALDVPRGLSVLTGETGAGKSILLDALGLVRGDRADAGLVQAGAKAATVSALFDLEENHPVYQILADQGVAAPGEGTLLLRRVVDESGKSRAYINDQMVSIGLMKTIGQMLIDLHGQFETGHLFDPAHHRRLLDQYGGHESLVQKTKACWEGWVEARRALETAQIQVDQAAQDAAYIADALQDFDKLSPVAGEEETLLARKTFLGARAQLAGTLDQVRNDLNGDAGAEIALARAARALDRMKQKLPGQVDTWLSQLDTALSNVRDVTSAIETMVFDHGEGPEDIEQIEDRLYHLRTAARRYGCTVDELPAKRDEFLAQYEARARGADALAEHRAACQGAEKLYLKAAGELTQARRVSGERLDHMLMRELSPLKLDKARFKTEVEDLLPAAYGPDGTCTVRFTAAMNPGAPFGAIDKVASGGELSRLMLALKVILRRPDHVCMVFDEVDSGLGGAVADAMGERLSRLARDAQVLVVTHAPQVAARADHHFIVAKKTKNGQTSTSVYLLSDEADQREEIARMLSGAKITDEARAAAQKLLSVQAA